MLGGLKTKQNKTKQKNCTPGPRDPTETESDLPLSVWVPPAEAQASSNLPRGQGLWLQQTWNAQCVRSTTEPPSRRPTNWRTIIPKKFLHWYKISRTHHRVPNLRIQKRDWELPGIWFWRPVGFIELPQDWGNRLLGTQTKSCAYQDQEERSSDPKRLS